MKVNFYRIYNRSCSTRNWNHKDNDRKMPKQWKFMELFARRFVGLWRSFRSSGIVRLGQTIVWRGLSRSVPSSVHDRLFEREKRKWRRWSDSKPHRSIDGIGSNSRKLLQISATKIMNIYFFIVNKKFKLPSESHQNLKKLQIIYLNFDCTCGLLMLRDLKKNLIAPVTIINNFLSRFFL